jgi:ferredoxin--NADP+ reductase
VSELAYGERLVEKLRQDELFGPLIEDKLIYYPTVTREPFRNRGRITDLLTSGQLHADAALEPFDTEGDRFMLCGSPAMLADLKTMFANWGLVEGNHGEPGDYVIERAFVER